jgi:PiT family inorganic phosphate transporter
MGVITLALIANGNLGKDASVPTWVIVAAATAISLGTYLGGWRIIRTLGHRITRIETPQGFSAETTSAVVILAASQAGYPLSTTHSPPAESWAPAWVSAPQRCTGTSPARWPAPGC